jgi:hypothetical protein
MMELPTREEIEQAWREINAAGPMAHDTLVLSALGIRNSRLSDAVRRMTEVLAKTLDINPSLAGILQALVMGCVVTGLNYGLRIGDARVAAATKAPTETPKELAATELWAWLGQDDQEDAAKRTGEIGLKQCLTPAGMIPMVGVVRQKMEKWAHQFEAQAMRSGLRIRLCRFTFGEVVRETEHGA